MNFAAYRRNTTLTYAKQRQASNGKDGLSIAPVLKSVFRQGLAVVFFSRNIPRRNSLFKRV
jgi:hypothetical protein